MSDNTTTNGLEVTATVVTDESSIQKANRSFGTLEEALKKLGSVDLKTLGTGIQDIAKAIGLLGAAGLQSIHEQTKGLLDAARAGLSTEQLVRWQNIARQFVIDPSELIANITAAYKEINELHTTGKLNPDKMTALGLTGQSLTDYINAKDNNSRMQILIKNSLASDKPIGDMYSLLHDAIGKGFADVYLIMKTNNIPFDDAYNKMTVFEDDASRRKALEFNREWVTLMDSLQSAFNRLAATVAERLLPAVEQLNRIVKDLKVFIDAWGDQGARRSALDKASEKVLSADIYSEEYSKGPNPHLIKTKHPAAFEQANFDAKVRELNAWAEKDPTLTQQLLDIYKNAKVGKSSDFYSREQLGSIPIGKPINGYNLLDTETRIKIEKLYEDKIKAEEQNTDAWGVPNFSMAPTLNIYTTPEAVGSPKELSDLVVNKLEQLIFDRQNLAQLGVS